MRKRSEFLRVGILTRPQELMGQPHVQNDKARSDLRTNFSTDERSFVFVEPTENPGRGSAASRVIGDADGCSYSAERMAVG